ncbi:MAG: hypothetical protein JXA25_17200 [Anaerolineales bacterium]|nr:hypothetical protein [Anaerolineales bacterium]
MAEDFDIEEVASEPQSNRTFVFVAVGMGAVLLLSIACLAAYLFIWAPRQRAAQELEQATEIAAANAQNTELALQKTGTAAPTATETLGPPTESPSLTPSLTATRTNTPVIVQATTTEEVTPWGTAATWTAIAGETGTALAVGQAGTEEPTLAPTALPDTGFADSFSPPRLALLALFLILVVILTRQIRKHSFS